MAYQPEYLQLRGLMDQLRKTDASASTVCAVSEVLILTNAYY